MPLSQVNNLMPLANPLFDVSYIYVLTGVFGLLGAWLGFIEKRLNNMQRMIEEKIKDKDEIHNVVQQGLKEDINRLEEKIDKLLFMYIGDKNAQT